MIWLPNLASLPYRDLSMTDRPGEYWKDVPGLELYYQVSNFGRIKRLARVTNDVLGRSFQVRPLIRQASVNKDRNMLMKDWTYRLQIVFQIGNTQHSFQVARLVYYCFVQKFDIYNPDWIVTAINGNGLDVRPDNLVLLDKSQKSQRPYDTGRQLSHLQTNKFKLIEIVQKSVDATSIVTSQYDQNGNKIATFKSIMEAARRTGISYAVIDQAIKHPARKVKDCYWRAGDANKVNMKEIREIIRRRRQGYREKRGVKVDQYNLQGEFIARFYTLSEAAKKTGISHKTITRNIKKQIAHAGGFVWRLATIQESCS